MWCGSRATAECRSLRIGHDRENRHKADGGRVYRAPASSNGKREKQNSERSDGTRYHSTSSSHTRNSVHLHFAQERLSVSKRGNAQAFERKLSLSTGGWLQPS